MRLLLFSCCLILLSPMFAMAKMPEVQEIVSADGQKMWVIEDHYLPIVSVQLAFKRSGFAYDDPEKLGLSYLVSSLLDEGVDGVLAIDYRKRLEELATTISFDLDEEYFYVSVDTLTENLDESIEWVSRVLTKPSFDTQAIARIKKQIQIMISKQQESPSYIAQTEFRKRIFGNHEYANPKYGKIVNIESITKNDLVAFVGNHFTSDNMLLSIVGDVSLASLSELVDKKLNLPDTGLLAPAIEKPQMDYDGDVIYIDQPVPQSVVIFGGKGVGRLENDFYPAFVVNHILGGGGFESRLMDTVRERNGLAYSVYSYLELLHKAGLFVGYVASDNSKVHQAIDLIKLELTNLHKSGVTNNEIKDAKDYLINAFPLRMTKNSKLASFLTSMQTQSLGIDFLSRRNEYVKNVTKVQANAVAKKMFDPNNILFVVVGKKL